MGYFDISHICNYLCGVGLGGFRGPFHDLFYELSAKVVREQQTPKKPYHKYLGLFLVHCRSSLHY